MEACGDVHEQIPGGRRDLLIAGTCSGDGLTALDSSRHLTSAPGVIIAVVWT